MTDLEPLLQSIGSTKHVTNKLIIPVVEQLKDCLKYKEVDSFAYVDSRNNLAAILTKQKRHNQEFTNVFRRGHYAKKKSEVIVELVEREYGNEIRVVENRLRMKT